MLALLPGAGLDERAWRPTAQHLASEAYGVVTLPGYGERRRGRSTSPDALATRLLDRLPDGPVVLVGHSGSCQVVAHAAAREERVRGLVLVGPTTDPRATGWGALARRWLASARHEDPRLAGLLLRQYARTGPVSMLRALDDARHDAITSVLAGLERPVAVVRGPYDAICPADWAASLANLGRAPGSSVVTTTGGAHLVPLTHGREVAAVLDQAAERWLAR